MLAASTAALFGWHVARHHPGEAPAERLRSSGCCQAVQAVSGEVPDAQSSGCFDSLPGGAELSSASFDLAAKAPVCPAFVITLGQLFMIQHVIIQISSYFPEQATKFPARRRCQLSGTAAPA